MTFCSGYTRVTRALVNAMNALGKTRLVLMHSLFTEPDSRDKAPSFWIRNILLPMIKPVLNDMHEAEKYLKTAEEARNIDWTTVLPGGLKNNPLTDREILGVEGQYSQVDGADTSIHRADVARFMIKVAEDKLYKKNCVAIGIKV